MSVAKINSGHLERLAVVYVRQSTPAQVRENRESTARQYALAERARGFGWPEERIKTLDCDLGHSAGDTALGTRSGFQELCTLITRGRVGGAEASFSRQRSKHERQECAACRARTASQNRASASACSASDRPCSCAYNRRQSGPAGHGAHAKIGSTPPTGGAGIVPCTSSRIAMHHT